MKIFLILLVALLVSFDASALQLTQAQFENLDELHKAVKKECPEDFLGFSGTKENMRVLGIPESEAERVIKNVDVEKNKSEKKGLKDEETLISKRMRKLSMDSLKAEGVVFKRVASE